jgi:hypothetical protein
MPRVLLRGGLRIPIASHKICSFSVRYAPPNNSMTVLVADNHAMDGTAQLYATRARTCPKTKAMAASWSLPGPYLRRRLRDCAAGLSRASSLATHKVCSSTCWHTPSLVADGQQSSSMLSRSDRLETVMRNLPSWSCWRERSKGRSRAVSSR